MPTASEAAASESVGWRRLTSWTRSERIGATEAEVVGYFDPSEDLRRRVSKMGMELAGTQLGNLAALASDLAAKEAEAWASDVPDEAMRNYHERRNLFGDRIVHWAVPWLDAVGRVPSAFAAAATVDRDWLLELGDELRVAPAFGSGEGLDLPDHDPYGPISAGIGDTDSLWCGAVVLDGEDAVQVLQSALSLWRRTAVDHPGTAALWKALAVRAESSLSELG